VNYQKIYNQIINCAKNRASSKKEANLILGYSEKHHIIPKCMEGTDEKSNIAHLSAQEHFVAHQLLVKIYPNEKGLIYSCMMMGGNKNLKQRTGKVYSWLKQKQSNARLGQNKHNNSSVAIMAAKLFGRTKETHEHVRIASEKTGLKLKGRTKENDEGIRTMASKLTGIKRKPESVQKSSQNRMKLTEPDKILLVDLHKNGMTFNKISEYFKNTFNKKISSSALQKNHKKLPEKNND
jgi:hypothetical protein